MYGLLRFVPKNHMSYFLGSLANLRLPRPMASFVIRRFASAYRIEVEESARPVREFRSLGEFFTRDLREGARPVEGDFV